jgi:hypothetical protein
MQHIKGELRICLLLSLTTICGAWNSYSQNLISNPGFESGNIPPWNIWVGDNSASVIPDAVNQFSGNYCAKLSGKSVYLYQSFSLEPNSTYKISAHIKTQPGQIAYLGAKGFGGTEVSVAFSITQYKTDSLVFTTGNNPASITQIFIWKPDGAGAVWVDDVTLVADSMIPGEIGGLGNYYISPQGNDTNIGNSPDQAWKTIQKVNQINFEPGDYILFEGGNSFQGTLQLNTLDTGTYEKNIYLGSYGNGRAIINATTGTGLKVNQCKYITIKNLSFIGDGRKTGNTGDGISLTSCSDINIDSVEISDFQHSGLITNQDGRNYRFTNINAHNNGYTGISVSGYSKLSQSNIYIGYCIADNNPGDPTILTNHSGNGIIAYNASNIIIEYCEASNNGWDMPRTGNGPGGIWVAEADNVVIQYCIAHDNKTSVGGGDGLGFDLDGGTTNSVIQYCLSYNNQGAGYGVYQYAGATKWENNTIRYCISENDGNVSGIGSVCFWNGTLNTSQFRNFNFYNNAVYNTGGPALNFVDHFNGYFNFWNNIFVSKDESVYNGIQNENFQGNCWYSLNNEFIIGSKKDFNQWARENNQEMYNGEIVGMYVDPEFLSPGKSTGTDPLILASATDYQVKDDSKVIDKGLDLKMLFDIDPGQHDYFGNSIKQGNAFDMGVFEKPNSTGIKERPINKTDEINIYPNPFLRGNLNIEWPYSESISDLKIKILSMDGRLLYTINKTDGQTTGNNHFAISISNSLPRGIYLVSLISKNHEIVNKKLIIQ